MTQAGYYRGSDGQIHFTAHSQREVCSNYAAMMKSNSQVNDVVSFGGSGATLGAFGWAALDKAMSTVGGKSLGVVGAVAGITTQLFAHAPPPPGCKP